MLLYASWNVVFRCLLAAIVLAGGLALSRGSAWAADGEVFCCYYPWYGTPAVDGAYRRWNHEVIRDGRAIPCTDGGLNLDRSHYWTDVYRRYIYGELMDLPPVIHVAHPESRTDNLAQGRPVILVPDCSPLYDGGAGGAALVDGLLGSDNYQDGRWLGFEGADATARISFGERVEVSAVAVRYLVDPGAWIFPPVEILIEASADGRSWRRIGVTHPAEVVPPTGDAGPAPRLETYGTQIFPVRALYLKVTLTGLKTCPDWHQGAGQPAWIFVDEVIVE